MRLIIVFILIFYPCVIQAQAGKTPAARVALKDKILLIPDETPDDLRKALERVGYWGASEMFELIKQGTEYSKVWNEAFAQSFYDATSYQIREYNPEHLLLEKNEKTLMIKFEVSYSPGNNIYACLVETGPAEKELHRMLINGLNMLKVDDVKLVLNIFNQTLNELILKQEEQKNASSRLAYHKTIVDFSKKISSMTLLRRYETIYLGFFGNKLEKHMPKWTLSPYEIVSREAIDEKRIADDNGSYYWISIPIYRNRISGKVARVEHYLILSCRDEVILQFQTNKSFNAATLANLEMLYQQQLAESKAALGL